MRRLIVFALIILPAISLLAPDSFGGLRQPKTTASVSTTRSIKQNATRPPSLSINRKSISAPATGKNGTLRVITKRGAKWNVTNPNSWFTVTPAIGQENRTLVYSISSNPDCVARTGTFSINDKTVTITQAGTKGVYLLSSSSASFTERGGTGSVGLNAPCSWGVQSDANWISNISPNSGSGDTTINYFVAENTESSGRSGSITILDGDSIVRQTLSITQAGAPAVAYSFSPNAASFTAAGGNSTVQFTASSSSGWTVRSAGKWITNISPTNGVGNAAISYSVTPNLNCDPRSSFIVLTDENSGAEEILAINQAPGTGQYSLSANVMAFTDSGGSDSIYLTTGNTCSWRTQTEANWITSLSSTNGTGSGYLTFSTGVNPSCASRSALIEILDADSVVRQTVTLSQAGSPARYSLSSAYLIFTANGGNVSVGLTASCSWTAQTDASWISNISPMSGNENAIINYSVAANTASGSRTGKIRILDGNSVVQQTLNITQGGTAGNYAISYTAATFPADARSSNVVLMADSSWHILNDSSWITVISSTSGSGNATLSYSVLPNTNCVSRTASIKVLDGNFVAQETLTITQDGMPAADLRSGQYRWSGTLGTTGNDSGNSIATDSQGNVLVTGNLDNHIFIEKYSKTGALIWSKNLDGGTGSGNAITVDQNDNVLVAGTFSSSIDFGGGLLSSVGNLDLFIAKYSSSGEHVWSKAFVGIEGDDNARSVAADSMGNVLVAGTMNRDIVLAKLSGADGAFLWSKQFEGSGNDNGLSVAVDSQDAVVMTGNFPDSIDFGGGILTAIEADIFLVKFSATGSHLWSQRFGGNLRDSGNGVAIDDSGNIILTGAFKGAADFGGGPLTSASTLYGDIFLAKFDGDGSHVWSEKIGSLLYDKGNSIALDHQGNIVLIGSSIDGTDFAGDSAIGDIFLAKYSAHGALLWSKRFGANTGADEGRSVAIDPQDNIIATGRFFSDIDFGGGLQASSGEGDAFVINLAP